MFARQAPIRVDITALQAFKMLASSQNELHARQVGGGDRRWTYAEMQQLKQQDEPKPLSEGSVSQNTEIFIMLPLGIITVGELREGGVHMHLSRVLQQ